MIAPSARARPAAYGWVGIVWTPQNSLINTVSPSGHPEGRWFFSRNIDEITIVLALLRIEF